MAKTTRRTSRMSKAQMRSTRRRPNRRNTTKKKVHVGSTSLIPRNVSNIVETRRRIVNPTQFQYETGGSVIKGLSANQSVNCHVMALNYGWENNQTSGDTDKYHFTGTQITPLFLKSKVQFSFPQDSDAIMKPMRIQVIWGFCTRPLQLTSYTTPKDSNVSREHIREVIQKQVEGDWDEPEDELKFREKNPTNLKIIGKRWVRPDRRFRIGVPQQYANASASGTGRDELVGGPPDVNMTLSWPVNKHKWKLTKSDASTGTGNPFWYNNQSWVPFFIVYNPDYANIKPADYPGTDPPPEAHRIQCRYSEGMWYKDC